MITFQVEERGSAVAVILQLLCVFLSIASKHVCARAFRIIWCMHMQMIAVGVTINNNRNLWLSGPFWTA